MLIALIIILAIIAKMIILKELISLGSVNRICQIMFNIILFVTRNSKNKHYSKIIYWYMHASNKLFRQYGKGSFFVQNF